MAAGNAFGSFFLDQEGWRLLRDGAPVEVQDKVLALIAALLERPGALWTREELHARLWPGVFVSDDALFQAVRKARAALSDDPRAPRFIETVQGRGYRFVGQLEAAPPPPPGAAVPERASATERGRATRPPELPLIGRERELAQVMALFAEGARLVTLLGPGGAGKTTLARAVGGGGPRPARFIDMSEALDRQGLLDALGEGLGADSGGPEAERAALRALPRGPDARVVLDNADRVTRPLAALLQDWLEQAPEVRFLVTSRRPLDLGAERVIPVGPLGPRAAASLFRARASARGVALSEEERGMVDEVVAAVDGLPLALELAASRVGLLGLGGLLDRLRRPLDVLQTRRADLPERQRSMRAALELSWSALDEQERAFLAGCCVFRAGFDVREAEAVVCGPAWEGPEAVELASTLLDASLLRVFDGSGAERRLAPYHLARELALQLGDPAWILAVRHRHLAWLAARADGLAVGQEPGPEALPGLAPLLEDGAQALLFGVEQGRRDAAARVARWLAPVMARRGAVRRALELLERIGPPEDLPPEDELSTRILLATLGVRGGRPEETPALFERAATRGRELGRPEAEAAALLAWSDVALGRDAAAARPVLARAADAVERARVPAMRAWLDALDASARFYEGEREEARAQALSALARLQRLDRGWWTAAVLLHLTEFAYLDHRYDEADAWSARALAVFERAEAPDAIEYTLGFVAVIRQAQGRLDEALELYRELLERARRAGKAQREQHLVYSVGGVLGMLGRQEEAELAFQEALALARQQRNAVHEGWVLLRLAGVSWRQRRWEAARRWLEQAIADFSAAGRPVLAETARAELGRVELMAGRPAAAEGALARALEGLQALPQGEAQAALTRALLAEARATLGQPGAVEEARAAVEDLRARWPVEGLARGLASLGQAQLAAGMRDEARASLAEAERIKASVGDREGDIARDARRLAEALAAV